MKSRVLIIALSVLSPIFVSAKPGTEHCKDMVDVLGIPQDKTSAAYRHANEVSMERNSQGKSTMQLPTNLFARRYGRWSRPSKGAVIG